MHESVYRLFVHACFFCVEAVDMASPDIQK